MKNEIAHFGDALIDSAVELTSTQTTRTGFSASRAAASLANGVAPEVVALQATLNSKKNNPETPTTFTAADVISVVKWHAANKTRTVLSKQQAGDIIRTQQASDGKTSKHTAINA